MKMTKENLKNRVINLSGEKMTKKQEAAIAGSVKDFIKRNEIERSVEFIIIKNLSSGLKQDLYNVYNYNCVIEFVDNMKINYEDCIIIK